jgi:hypothetical protein
MPIPRPNINEGKERFISRCVAELRKNDPNRPINVIEAICYNQWNDRNKVASMSKSSPEHGLDCPCCH